MSLQEDGWPLGLQPLNVRAAVARNIVGSSESTSFNTLFSISPTSSTDSSPDLDRESTASFHHASITLGSLIGITANLLELSSRSFRSRRVGQHAAKNRKSTQKKPRAWLFVSLCARAPADGEAVPAAACKMPSLGHFLEQERRANGVHRRNRVSIIYEMEGEAESQPVSEPNSAV